MKSMKWPVNSPNLNIIKNLREKFKNMVFKMAPSTKDLLIPVREHYKYFAKEYCFELL